MKEKVILTIALKQLKGHRLSFIKSLLKYDF